MANLSLVACDTKIKQVNKKDKSLEYYAQVFNEIDSVLKKDNGKLWEYSLKGPLFFVDIESRRLFANQNNLESSFKKVGNVYTDTLPKQVNMANTAFDWDGIRWTMVMLPLPKEEKARINLITHELFHGIQPKIGFNGLKEKSNQHLDGYHGRLLLKLELEALIQAINAEGEHRKKHIKNALKFRKTRHISGELEEAENSLELNEGLAEYTGVMLSDRSSEDLKIHFRNRINQFYKNGTFVRSFAYETVPMYGHLLSKSKEKWHLDITKSTNLTDYFEDAFSVKNDTIVSFESIAKIHQYDFEKIKEEEKLREQKRLEVITNYKNIFLNKPTLKLVFENMKISFDPRNIVPVDNIGTVYPTLRITDNWGVLTVDNDAFLSSDWKYVLVTEPNKVNDSMVSGTGWRLELKDSWRLEKIGDTYKLKKK
ncbi:MAG: hypothetical protein AAF348_03185 [Bacteroidota bacterium]